MEAVLIFGGLLQICVRSYQLSNLTEVTIYGLPTIVDKSVKLKH